MTDYWLAVLSELFPTGIYYKNIFGQPIGDINWNAIAAVDDPVLLKFPYSDLGPVIQSLFNHGLGPSTECVLLQDNLIFGTLGDISVKSGKMESDTVYLLLFENLDVVKDRLTGKKLEGKTVLVTRASTQSRELTELLSAQGARVVELPAIEIVLQSENVRRLEKALANIPSYSWLILTSANTVSILNDVLKRLKLDWTLFSNLQIACIGKATSAAVEASGGCVSLVPRRFQAESLAEELLQRNISGQKILLPRAAGSRKILPQSLSEAGAMVHEIQIYRAEIPSASNEKVTRILNQPLDFITFTSSSTVHNFMELVKGQLDFSKTRVACIGPITAATLREYEIEPAIEAREFTIAGLVQALIDFEPQRH